MRYDGGTLNPRMTELRERRRQVRLALAAGTGTGSQKYQTTDKVRNMDANVQSAIDAANKASTDATAAQSAASDAQSGVTVLTSRLAASTVLYTRTPMGGSVDGTAVYRLSIPAAPGAYPRDLALVTVGVVGSIVFASPEAPRLELRYVDGYGETDSITWTPPVVDAAGAYPGVPGLVARDVNMSCSLWAQGYSDVLLFFLPFDTNGGPRPYFSIRVDYPPTAPAAPEAASLMAAKPADGDGPTMPELPPGFELDATKATPSTDIKEQSS